ncbi:MAG: recombinase family protein [Rhodospirillales bacterium]|nr:recombinase family protein [Rhodospirillales bacterium]
MRVAIYLRVSTVRQAEKDVSIPDQHRNVTDYCDRQGWTVVEEYIERGRSARDDKRPVFQRMIDDALKPDKPFDHIVVHTFSRFFRDEVYQELYIRKLVENGVKVQSVSEEVGDGMSGEVTRRIMGIIAEVENRQRQARVIQTMQENARQGFWNGGLSPFGYRTVVAEMRGDTAKKRLEINPEEAEKVRLIYRLYLHGDGDGPMGIKTLVGHLNAKGYHYRNRAFRINEVHRILRSSTYMGLHYYNKKNAKTRKLRDPSEWITMEVPAIIEPDVYEAIQKQLEKRRPTVTPPRLTNGSMLMTGIATCPHCGGGMSLRTGKGGKYRYYTCSHSATKGKAVCAGRSIRMDRLDSIVIDALESRLLDPERLKEVLSGLAKRILEQQGQSAEQGKELNRELRKIDAAIEKLFEAVENGTVDDDDFLRRRLSKHKQRHDEIVRLMAHNRRRREVPRNLLAESNLNAFGAALRKRLRDPKPGLRRAYVKHFVDRVVVGEEAIEIRGSNAALMSAASDSSSIEEGEVPSFMDEWRRGWDSNPRYA